MFPIKKKSLIAILIFGMLNFLLNLFPLSLYFSVEFIFGNIASLLASVLFGPWVGFFSSLLGNSITIFLWHDPYAMITMALEALFVGYVFKKNYEYTTESILIYWFLIGCPFGFLYYRYILNGDLVLIQMVLLKRLVNELMNISIVNILLLVNIDKVFKKDFKRDFDFFPITYVIKNFFLAVTLASLLTLSLVGIKSFYNLSALNIKNNLNSYIQDLGNKLNIYFIKNPNSDSVNLKNFKFNNIKKPDHLIFVLDNDKIVWSSKHDLIDEDFSLDKIEALFTNANLKSKVSKASNNIFIENDSFIFNDKEYIVYAATSATNLFYYLNKETILYFLSIIVIFITMIFLSTLVSEKIATPIKRLSDATPHLLPEDNKESPITSIKSNIKEIATLINSFNQSTEKLIKSYRSLKESNGKLNKMVVRDALTNLYNRRYSGKFYKDLEKSFSENYSVLMMDIDHFKSINDNFGHQIGDEVLIVIANILKNNSDENASAIRYGGEEFLLLLKNSNKSSAEKVAEEIRHIVETYPWDTILKDSNFPVTISIGVAYSHYKGEHIDDLISRADTCLYESKQSGRNKITVE